MSDQLLDDIPDPTALLPTKVQVLAWLLAAMGAARERAEAMRIEAPEGKWQDIGLVTASILRRLGEAYAAVEAVPDEDASI